MFKIFDDRIGCFFVVYININNNSRNLIIRFCYRCIYFAFNPFSALIPAFFPSFSLFRLLFFCHALFSINRSPNYVFFSIGYGFCSFFTKLCFIFFLVGSSRNLAHGICENFLVSACITSANILYVFFNNFCIIFFNSFISNFKFLYRICFFV